MGIPTTLALRADLLRVIIDQQLGQGRARTDRALRACGIYPPWCCLPGSAVVVEPRSQVGNLDRVGVKRPGVEVTDLGPIRAVRDSKTPPDRCCDSPQPGSGSRSGRYSSGGSFSIFRAWSRMAKIESRVPSDSPSARKAIDRTLRLRSDWASSSWASTRAATSSLRKYS